MSIMLKFSPPPVTVKLVGGLGNQFFGFFAGQYLASILNTRLTVDLTEIRSGRNAHESSIESFTLDVDYIERNYCSTVRLLIRIIGKVRKLGFLVKGSNYFSKVVGFDDNLEKIESPVTLNGYFQSYRYFYSIRDSIKPIELKNPSSWYLTMEKQFKSQPFTALHIRRGDYRELGDSYGLLSFNYYKSCLDRLKLLKISYPIYIFTDDINSARQMFDDSLDVEINWITPPSDADPAESLLLMSKAKVNIIANSTFSWWGAALNETGKVVLAPEKWFKAMPDPEFLYPPEWLRIASQWEV
jgi:hypothetical protein